MRVLITGGAGFVGQWLQRCLEDTGHAVWAPSSELLDVGRREACRDWVQEAEPDWVFHLAARTERTRIALDPEGCLNLATQGTRNILEAVSETPRNTRVVVASSCHVYGSPQVLPLKETHPLGGESVYARSKRALEGVASEVSGVEVVVARLFHLVGPGQSPAFAVAGWARQGCQGSEEIRVGNLAIERDYLDVRDGVSALLVLADRGRAGHAYNVCSGRSVRLRWLFDRVASGRAPRVDPARVRSDDAPCVVGDCSQLTALGWAPEFSLEQSLRDLVDSLKD